MGLATEPLTWSSTERDTLLALWDDRENWFAYFYRLSDRLIEDGDEPGGEAIQWLYRWEGRPNQWSNFLEKYKSGWFWWTHTQVPETVRRWKGERYPPDRPKYDLWLPPQFESVCCGYGTPDHELHYPDPLSALSAAIDCYKTFTPETRSDLWTQWIK